MIRLTLNGQEADLSTSATKISLTKVIKDYNDANKLTGSFSQPFQLPFTNRNRQIFNYADDIQVNAKFAETYEAVVYDDDVVLLEGVYILSGVLRSKRVFDGYVYATNISRLADIIPAKTLNQIGSYDFIDFVGNATVLAACKDNDLKYEKGKSYHAFTYLYDSFWNLENPRPFLAYDYFGLSAFTGGIIEKIFEDAGYKVGGTVLDSEEWQRLTLLYTNNEIDGYNYGVLAPMSVQIDYSHFTVSQVTERDDDVVYVINYTGTKTGDLAHCLFNGVYTPKYGGDYELSVGGQGTVRTQSGSNFITASQFSVLRELDGGDVMDTAALPPANNFTAQAARDTAVVLTETQGRQLVRLKKGVQYRVQTYISVAKAFTGGQNVYVYYSGGFKFNIHSCTGKQKINIADFLPSKIKCVDFISMLFKLFNLYYVLDDDAKTVMFYTRDEFFLLRASNILDISNFTDLSTWDDTPFTKDEVNAIFYTFQQDSSDYQVARTDYYTTLSLPDFGTANSLITAPVSYIQQPVGGANYQSGEDILATAINDSDSEDDSVLVDETSSSFAYEPKLAFYYAAGSLYDPMIPTYLVPVGPIGLNGPGSAGGYHPLLFTFKPGSAALSDFAFYPKLFFDSPANQTAYQVVKDPVRRSFRVKKATGVTIWQTQDPDFIPVTVTVPAVSLNPNTPSSLFQQLYAQNLKTVSYSYYSEGYVHVNSALYTQLTEGVVIKMDTAYYVVDTVSEYVAGGITAKVKAYRYI